MYRYETHLHTYPVSRCAKRTVRENLEYYKGLGYDGVFVTNHFLDGNINIERDRPFAEKLDFYCSDYEQAKLLSEEIGIRVFFGVEMSYKGTDFLVYGLHKAWYAAHPEIIGMERSAILSLLKENGALVVQAHPYREANYIDHIRLFPRHVHGIEIVNASRPDFENDMAAYYAQSYGLIPFAGSDNHRAEGQPHLAGVQFETPIRDEADFVARVLAREAEIFRLTPGTV